jgi:ribonuclease P protein component
VRERRLVKKADFNYVFDDAKKIVSGNITLLYKSNNLTHARLGFAISKRFATRAVLRNKIRRVLKESFRLQMHLPAYDMVILLNQTCDKQKIELIRNNIERLWQKLS